MCLPLVAAADHHWLSLSPGLWGSISAPRGSRPSPVSLAPNGRNHGSFPSSPVLQPGVYPAPALPCPSLGR